MFAKILHNNSVYYSPVFAVSMKGTNNKVIVFDSSFEKLIVVDIFKRNHDTALFMNYDTKNFAINDVQFKSYWNDRNIFRTVKNQKYSLEMLQDAKAILNQSKPQEYTEIKSSFDLDALDMNSGAFHDGYILGMQEKDGILEILLDTSCGSLIILKCHDVIENSLIIGETFSWCDMRKDDEYVEFSFDPMFCENEKVLKAKQIKFKPLFEKRIDINQFEYRFSNDKLLIKSKNGWVEIDPASNNILDLKQRSVLGYLENMDNVHRCLMPSGYIVYGFFKFENNLRLSKKITNKIQEFQKACEQKGLLFDLFPFSDDEDFSEDSLDYGELLYSHKYSAAYPWITLFQGMMFMLILHNGLWLTFQYSNPQMKWAFYFIMGPGISLVTILIVLIAALIGFIKNKRSGYEQTRCLEIYENRLKNNGYNTSFNVDYENIIQVEYNKRIIVQTSWVKYKLHKFKDDKTAYEFIKKQLEKFKSQKT